MTVSLLLKATTFVYVRRKQLAPVAERKPIGMRGPAETNWHAWLSGNQLACMAERIPIGMRGRAETNWHA